MCEACSSADQIWISVLENNATEQRTGQQKTERTRKEARERGGDARLVADAEERIVDALHGGHGGRRRWSGCGCRGAGARRQWELTPLAAAALVLLSQLSSAHRFFLHC